MIIEKQIQITPNCIYSLFTDLIEKHLPIRKYINQTLRRVNCYYELSYIGSQLFSTGKELLQIGEKDLAESYLSGADKFFTKIFRKGYYRSDKNFFPETCFFEYYQFRKEKQGRAILFYLYNYSRLYYISIEEVDSLLDDLITKSKSNRNGKSELHSLQEDLVDISQKQEDPKSIYALSLLVKHNLKGQRTLPNYRAIFRHYYTNDQQKDLLSLIKSFLRYAKEKDYFKFANNALKTLLIKDVKKELKPYLFSLCAQLEITKSEKKDIDIVLYYLSKAIDCTRLKDNPALPIIAKLFHSEKNAVLKALKNYPILNAAIGFCYNKGIEVNKDLYEAYRFYGDFIISKKVNADLIKEARYYNYLIVPTLVDQEIKKDNCD